MMSTGYDAASPSSNYAPFEQRRSSGHIPQSYHDRPMNGPARQPSLSPGPSRRPYDAYVPLRPDTMPYRNVYRPNNYRPEASGSYYSRSPSPDAYAPPPRSTDVVSRDRGSSWRPPPTKSYESSDRRPLPPSPTRRFEPSDTWKQTHIDRPGRPYSPSHERHFDRRGRGSLDSSPDRSARPAFIPGGDRYRPGAPFKRETFPPGRPDYDSYRPQYENDWPPPPRRDLPPSPVNGHFRRDSGSSGQGRPSERAEFVRPHARRSSLSATPLVSPAPVLHSPGWDAPELPWASSPSALDVAKRDPPTRIPSRSSIASTHVSDRRSPGVASIPQPTIPLPAGLPAKPQAAIDALANESRRENAKFEHKAVNNGVHRQPPPMNAHIDTKLPNNPVTAVRDFSEQPSKSGPTSQAVRQDSGIRGLSSTSKAQISTPAINGHAPSPAPSKNTPLGAEQIIPAKPDPSSEPSETQPTITTSKSGPSNNEPLEVKQPKPISPLKRIPSAKDNDVLDVDIPPPTHSPSLSPDPSKLVNGEDPILAYNNLPRPDDIPPLSSAKTKEEALRITIMTRMMLDRQTREARVDPVLMANLAIAPAPEVHPTATPESLMDRMFTGMAYQARIDTAERTLPLLKTFLSQRRAAADDKAEKLRQEYLKLQQRWTLHCNALNEQQKTLASEQETLVPTRATRRSMAITDAVRSDFEMEQIIASLGNDDATDPNHLSIQNLAKVPDMISAVNGKIDYLFDDNNYLVENPVEYYSPDSGIEDWTETEKKTFLEKFGAFPKQFGLIADYLPNKTAAQCVAYYYLNKKMFIDFRKIILQYAPNKRKRRGMGRKKGNGLLADIAMHDLEVNRGSGAASPSTGPTPRATRGRKSLKEAAPAAVAKSTLSSRRNIVQFEDTPTSTPTPEPESRSRKRKVASNASMPSASAVTASSATSALSSSTTATSVFSIIPPPPLTSVPLAMQAVASTFIPTREEEAPEPRPAKRAKRTRKIKSALMVMDEPASPPLQPVALPTGDVASPSSSSRGAKKDKNAGSAQWAEEDKNLFLSLLAQYGDDFKRIAASMPSKTMVQVSNYYKNNSTELKLAEIAAKAAKRSHTPELLQAQWKEVTFPAASEVQMTMQMSPPALMNMHSNPPMSALAYDPTRNVYPASQSQPYPGGVTTSPRSSIHNSPWSRPPMPTRLPTAPNYPGPSPSHAGSHPAEARPPMNGPPYFYPPHTSPRGFSFSSGPGHLPPPSRSGPSSPNVLSRSPHEHRDPLRPRISTSHSYSSVPLSHSPIANGQGPRYAAATPPPLPASSASAIVHSPTIPSPKLPPSSVNHGAYLPPPTLANDPRDHGRYLPPATHSPVESHSHSRQPSGSSASGVWGPSGSAPGSEQRYHGPPVRPPGPPSYGGPGNDRRRDNSYPMSKSFGSPQTGHPPPHVHGHGHGHGLPPPGYSQPGWYA